MFEGSKPTIRVGAGKFLGVRRIFARIFPNLPEKFLGHFLCEEFLMTTVFGMTSKKRSSCDSEHVWRHFFQTKVRWAPFLPVFSGSLPRFSGILRKFSQIFRDFSRIFTKSKRLVVRLKPLHPRLLHR